MVLNQCGWMAVTSIDEELNWCADNAIKVVSTAVAVLFMLLYRYLCDLKLNIPSWFMLHRLGLQRNKVLNVLYQKHHQLCTVSMYMEDRGRARAGGAGARNKQKQCCAWRSTGTNSIKT